MVLKMTAAAMAFVCGIAALSMVPVQAKDQLLGEAVYEAKPQRDVVKVGKMDGAFKAIRLEVKGSDVEVLNLKVVYGNGNPEDINVRQTFKAGSSSRDIDLKGQKRNIKEIVVTYVAKGPARIQFIGIEAPRASWEPLGCANVSFAVDRDVIKVGRKEGSYSAIRLKVLQAPVEIFELRVVFGNGTKQDFRIRAAVPAGAETKPIDLTGNQRGIDRVELLYRSLPTFKGKAQVCVDGLQR